MTAIHSLSVLWRSLIQLWALLVCYANVFCLIYTLTQKQYRHALAALPGLAVGFFLWEVMHELTLYAELAEIAPLSVLCTEIGWIWWTVILLLASLLTAYLIYEDRRYFASHLTSNAVKNAADQLTCGICYWRDGGRVILSNSAMNRLCFAVTGEPLLNGEQFFARISEPVLTVRAQTWSFSHRVYQYKGAPLHELVATDVTELYVKTEALKRDAAELSQVTEELKAYQFSIDETVRRQEILQAKRSIHDEMNRLMLTTVAAEHTDRAELDRIFALWQQNALLLCRESAEHASKSFTKELSSIAEALGIELQWCNSVPEALSKQQRSLLFSAGQEALANAMKHAGAKRMRIRFEKSGGAMVCCFLNDGILPKEPLQFTGGLANLRRLAYMRNAEIEVQTIGEFTLCIRLNPPFDGYTWENNPV